MGMGSAVIPAFNEATRIEGVLRPLLESPYIQQIIVVDDGSRDHTAAIARSYGVEVMRLSQNQGKARAVQWGLTQCKGDVILLMDADLVGLTPFHVEQLMLPVLQGRADTTLGKFIGGRVPTRAAQIIAPGLSGQRAFSSRFKTDLIQLKAKGYALELALNQFCKERNLRVEVVPLADLTHVMKEEKLGFAKGISHRWEMYWDMLRFWMGH